MRLSLLDVQIIIVVVMTDVARRVYIVSHFSVVVVEIR